MSDLSGNKVPLRRFSVKISQRVPVINADGERFYEHPDYRALIVPI